MTYVPPSRNLIFEALFALSEEVVWNDGTSRFLSRSRRVKEWGDVEKPGLCQSEMSETAGERSQINFRTWGADWFIYHEYAGDPDAIPSSWSNMILDAVEAVFVPKLPDPGFRDERMTLGGLVHNCAIAGDIVKISGDLDNQGLLVVPIRLIVP